MGRKNHTEEYKKEIINLVTKQKKKVTDVAYSIGVDPSTINKWIRKYKEYGNEAFPGKGNLRTEEKELKKLHNKIKDLEMENEILKKAMAIFSKGVNINIK
jgi:transposase